MANSSAFSPRIEPAALTAWTSLPPPQASDLIRTRPHHAAEGRSRPIQPTHAARRAAADEPPFTDRIRERPSLRGRAGRARPAPLGAARLGLSPRQLGRHCPRLYGSNRSLIWPERRRRMGRSGRRWRRRAACPTRPRSKRPRRGAAWSSAGLISTPFHCELAEMSRGEMAVQPKLLNVHCRSDDSASSHASPPSI